ncbi:MAG TPA: IS66 family transposase [Chitinophagaceae bacterium]
MKREDITNVLTNLKPAIEAITDNNVKIIINALITIINEQQKVIEEQRIEIEDLKEKLNINSDNSSNPPSTTPFKPDKKKKKGKRNRGGQPGHPGVTRNLLPENKVDHFEKHLPPEQCSCGGKVQVTPRYRKHQVHELPPIKIEVTEHQLFYGCCEECKKIHSAELPSSAPTGMLGICLLALIATLGSDYKMSKRDVARLFADLFKLTICIATVKRAEETVSAALKAPVEEAKAYVKEKKIVNCDETSHAECGKRMWTWVAVANMVAVFMIATTRCSKVAKALLGEGFNGILGSDRYSAYSWVLTKFRQVCWAHLKRDFKKISERSGQSKWIGLRLLYYTRLIFHHWHKVCDGTMSRETFKMLMRPIRRRVEILLMTGTFAENSKTRNTCFQILKIKGALWTFIDAVGVEPTNNIAERVLRQIVIWRKICFGTWSSNGTLYLERVMTVVATCRLQERSVFGFLCDVMHAHIGGTKLPSLLPSQLLIQLSKVDLAVAA